MTQLINFVSSEFDELLGADPSPLDLPLAVTIFPDAMALRLEQRCLSLRDLAEEVTRPTAISKPGLPLLKLGTFGNSATEKGCLRSTSNMLTISGVEADYDAQTISLETAANRLREAGIATLLYSSPSHTADGPRWRAICPTSGNLNPSNREALVARLNGVIGGSLAGESFTPSQAFYFGRIEAGHPVKTVLIDGRSLDLASDLDAGALGRDGKPYSPDKPTLPIPAANDDAPDWPRIDSALSAIPVSDADDQATGGRDLYLRIGQALHHVSDGSDEARQRWDVWARDGAKYNARHLARDWRSFGRSTSSRPVTIGSLFDIATRAYAWDDPGRTITGDDFDPEPVDEAIRPTPNAPPRLRFLTPSDCTDAPRRGYIVKGLLAPGDLGCIFGAPGAGKSLIAPHIAYQLARGMPAFGMRTKPGRTFYVPVEDPHGMKGRVTALQMRHGDAPEFVLVEGVNNLFESGSDDMAALLDAIEEQRPALIVIDTLAMAFPGLEENAAEDMIRVVTLGRRLAAHGAAVVLVHHDTKAQGPTPRGHSALNGALDMAMQLFPKDEVGVVRGKLTKNRNGSCDRDIAFRIATESLGEDEDGDLITAALVEELAPGAAPKAEKLTTAEKAAFQIFGALLALGTVTEDAWRDECVNGRAVSGSENLKTRQTQTRRAIQGLAAKFRVIIKDGVVQRPVEMPDAFDMD